MRLTMVVSPPDHGNLRLLRQLGVVEAVHYDMDGLQRIIGTVEAFVRVLAISNSPANAMTLCLGCFAEGGHDLPALNRRWAGRIGFVHVRNVRGTWDDFIETFPDDGQTNMLAVFEALAATGFDGPIRSDHASLLACDDTANDGYATGGHIFAMGYLRGLAEAAIRSNGP